jgi:hypothetical protein
MKWTTLLTAIFGLIMDGEAFYNAYHRRQPDRVATKMKYQYPGQDRFLQHPHSVPPCGSR